MPESLTTKTISEILKDFVKRVALDLNVTNPNLERSFDPLLSNLRLAAANTPTTPESFANAKSTELATAITFLERFVKETVGHRIVDGLFVKATDPPSNRIRVLPGLCYVEGQRIETSVVQTITVDMASAFPLFVYVKPEGTIGINSYLPEPSLALARIEKPSSSTTSVIKDDAAFGGIEAYIVSARDVLFDNTAEFDDASIAALRNITQELLASNLIGTIRLSESLKIQNTQGSLAMDSKEIRISSPGGNTLSKFNANGVFFFAETGEEFSHFGRQNARLGNIQITPNSLQSANFLSGLSGFQIRSDGNAEFNNVTVRGTIFAQTGAIGGWQIGATSLVGGFVDLNSSGVIRVGGGNDIAVLSAVDPLYRFWTCNSVPSLAPFSVKKDGSLFSSSGTIGGWIIGQTSLAATNVILSSDLGGFIQLGTGISLFGGLTGSIQVGTGIQLSGAGGGVITVGPGVSLNGATGSIIATQGQIGGWSLAANKLFAADVDIFSSAGGSIRVGSILLTGATSKIDVGTAIDIIGTGAGLVTIGPGITLDGATEKITLSGAGSFIAGDTTLNSQGLAINGTYSSISLGTGNNVVKLNTSEGLYLGAALQAFAPFSVSMQGELRSALGIIAGWSISPSQLISPGSSLVLDSANQLINVGTTIRIDGLNQRIESTNYQSGVAGWRIDGIGNAEFQNAVIRGNLHTSVFVKDEIHATNGQMLISDATTLTADITPSTAKLYIKDAVFSVGYRLRMKTALKTELLKVTQIGSDGGGNFVQVTRNLDAFGAFSWDSGTAIVSVESRVSLVASGTPYLPYVDVIERTDDFMELVRARLGNLNGISGATGYGLWSQNVFLTGTISATAGAIAGWLIAGNQLKSANDTIILDSFAKRITANTIIIDGAANRIDVGNFVDLDGSAGGRIIIGTINDVYLDGATASIFAKKGEIGGWILSPTSLKSDGGATPILSLTKGTDATITITDGATTQIVLGKYSPIAYGLKAGDATLNSQGLTISGALSSISLGSANTVVKLNTSEGLYIGNALQNLAPFSVTMAGILKAVSGSVGGWNLAVSSLSGGNVLLDSAGIITLGSGNGVVMISAVDVAYRLWAGNSSPGSAPFRVQSNGTLFASSADIEGSLKASSGYIGSAANGWAISATKITAVGSGLIETASGSTVGIKLDSTSLRGYDGSLERFRLSTNGSGFLGAPTLLSWSSIGDVLIGGFTVTANSLTAGSGSNAIGMATAGSYAFFAGNADPNSAPFRVSFAGQLIATNATLSGAVTATTLTATNSGNLAGWTISATALVASPGSQIKSSAAATTNGIVIDDTGIKGYGNAIQKFSLTASDGRLFANEADIGRKIVKITSTSNAGTAINSAIALLGTEGGIIFIPAGTYFINTAIVITDNITIQGAGPKRTFLKPAANLSQMIQISFNVDNFELLDLEINGLDGSFSANYCVSVAGASGVENLRLTNCTFRNAAVANVNFEYSGREIIDGCVFYVKTGAIGVNFAHTVRNCNFYALTVGQGTGISAGVMIINNRFTDLNIGVSAVSLISGCTFNNCNNGVYVNFLTEDFRITNNQFVSFNSYGIHLDSRHILTVISHNTFSAGAGNAIRVETPLGACITNNVIYNCALTNAIVSDGGSTESETQAITVSDNVIYDNTLQKGIYVNLLSNPSDDEATVISGNVLHDNTSNTNITGIDVRDNQAVVKGNVIRKLISTSSTAGVSVLGINFSTNKGTCSGNTITNLQGTSLPASGSVQGILNSGDNCIVGNNIQFNNASTQDITTGISGQSTQSGLVLMGNRLVVTNNGGTGKAFFINTTNGVALGNSYNGSNQLGTLTLSAGVVANNDA